MAKAVAARKPLKHIQISVPPELYEKLRRLPPHITRDIKAKFVAFITDYATELELRAQHPDSRTEPDFITMGKDEIEALYGEATGEAIASTHAQGFPTTHADDRGIYRLYPDGHKEYIYVEEEGPAPGHAVV